MFQIDLKLVTTLTRSISTHCWMIMYSFKLHGSYQ